MTINILIIGAICAVAVLIVPRFLGRGKGKMLSQYGVLGKRFRLKRHAFASKWGRESRSATRCQVNTEATRLRYTIISVVEAGESVFGHR